MKSLIIFICVSTPISYARQRCSALSFDHGTDSRGDFAQRVDNLDRQALLAIRKFGMTLESIYATRQTYARYQNTERVVFDCEHSRLKMDRTENVTLLGRLKLWYMQYDQGSKKHSLSDEEITLLITYKEELSLYEQTAVTKLQPGLLSRIKSFMS